MFCCIVVSFKIDGFSFTLYVTCIFYAYAHVYVDMCIYMHNLKVQYLNSFIGFFTLPFPLSIVSLDVA